MQVTFETTTNNLHRGSIKILLTVPLIQKSFYECQYYEQNVKDSQNNAIRDFWETKISL